MELSLSVFVFSLQRSHDGFISSIIDTTAIKRIFPFKPMLYTFSSICTSKIPTPDAWRLTSWKEQPVICKALWKVHIYSGVQLYGKKRSGFKEPVWLLTTLFDCRPPTWKYRWLVYRPICHLSQKRFRHSWPWDYSQETGAQWHPTVGNCLVSILPA